MALAETVKERLAGLSGLFKRGSTPPFAAFEWIIAGRYMRARRRGGGVSVVAFFSVLGIALGVATLIIVLSVMNGFRTELPLQDRRYQRPRLRHADRQAVHRLRRPFRQALQGGRRPLGDPAGGRAGLRVLALWRQWRAGPGYPRRGHRVHRVHRQDHPGRHPRRIRRRNRVAIGRRLAESLGVQAGDQITLSTPKGATTPFGTAPRTKAYTVKAIFEIGMTEFDATFVFMPLAESQAFFNRDSDVSLIEVYLDNADAVAQLRPDLEMAAERPVLLTDWRQRNRTFFGALEVERNVMFLILSLIVVVATLNIVSGLILLVRDKSSDIAILRTMGATPGTVMRVFLINGALIGVVGTLSGLALGVLITLNIKPIQRVLFPSAWDPTVRFLAEIPAEMNSSEITVVVLTSIALSLVATLYPSWRAARLDPVQALRYG